MKRQTLAFFSAAFLCFSIIPEAKANEQLERLKNDSLNYWSNFVIETETYCQANKITNANLRQLCIQIPHQQASFYQRRLEQATCLRQLIGIVKQIKDISQEFASSVEENQG
ncbi:hypothetical protein IQ238_21280 [Pleurocapsales cyanobacterium LEGE 06147]|nr:hypothetical protein [Pleurocapsales cyanobacterium LEGE 06147]